VKKLWRGMAGGVIAVSVSVMASASVRAADMQTPYKAAPAAIPATGYDWSGMYIGGHVGGGWSTTDFSDPSAAGVLYNCCLLLGEENNPTAPTGGTASAFLGGAQIGWMYQVQRLVIGVDVDWSGMRANNSGGFSFPSGGGATGSATETYGVTTNWTATATSTIGIARDRWMIFGKAGGAWVNNSYTLNVAGSGGTFALPGTPFALSSSTSDTITGWTVGAGVKWALIDNLFINVEYDFLDFGSKAENFSGTFTATPACFTGTSCAAGNFNPVFRQYIQEVKAGLNYKFPSFW
jgi:outer membrane immunogenic protein